MERFILRAAQMLDGSGAPATGPVAVVVNQERIERVALGHQIDDLPAGIPVIDAGDRTLLPGLIDAHVHLCFNAAADHAAVRAEIEGQTEVRIALRAASNAAAALAAGITTVRDCGGTGTIIQQLRDAVAAGVLPGPHILACGSPITTTAGHLHFCGMIADNLDEVRKAVRQIVRQRADWIKIMASGGNMTAGSNPWMPQYSAGEIQAAVDEAHRLRKRIAAHILCAESVRHCVAAGVDTLEHCLWSNPDGKLDWDDRAAETIIRRQTPIVYTAAGITRLNLPNREQPEDEQAAALARLREELLTTRRFHEAGANIVIASDAGVRMTPLDSFHLSLRVAVEGIGMSIEEAIHSVTGRAAAALGLEAETGTIAPGKRADLLVINGHLDDSFATLADPTLIVKAGKAMQPGWKVAQA